MIKRMADIPNNCEIFVDSSVLVYVHGEHISSELVEKYDKQNYYMRTVGTLLNNNRKLVTSWLNVMEVLSVHEEHMRRDYASIHGLEAELSLKRYRRMSDQRIRVQAELERILREITTYYTVVPVTTDETVVDRFVSAYAGHLYDPNDFTVVEAMLNHVISAVITDDTDFHDDVRITVYAD